MNSRERVLAAIRCQPVDRVPFAPLVGGYSMASMPPRYRDVERWQLYRDLEIDLFRSVRAFAEWPPESFIPPSTMLPAALLPAVMQKPPVRHLPNNGIDVRTLRNGHESSVIVDTPVGSLRSLWQQTPGSPQLPFPTEPMLKTVDDVKIYEYILERTVVEPWYDDLLAIQTALGNSGIADAFGQCTPVQDLIMFHMGLENFVFMLMDQPGEINVLLDLMQEVRRKEYRVLAESPAEIVITGENTSSTLLSPSLMAQYEFPALEEYTDILHSAGKLHLIHMCGKVSNALDLISQASFDGIIDVAPAPTGDCDFGIAHRKLRQAGKCLGGGIDCTAFARLTPQGMEEYVFHRLNEIGPGTGFLLGSGDCVPFGTPIENLRAVVRALDSHGRHPVGVGPERGTAPATLCREKG